MPNYVFLMESSPSNLNSIAFYDEVGDAQCYYMAEFGIFFQNQHLPNLDEILVQFCAGIFSHEDLHEAIVNSGVHTGAGQDHDLMQKVVDWLNKP